MGKMLLMITSPDIFCHPRRLRRQVSQTMSLFALVPDVYVPKSLQ